MCDKCNDYYHEFCVSKMPDEVLAEKSSKYCCTACSGGGGGFSVFPLCLFLMLPVCWLCSFLYIFG